MRKGIKAGLIISAVSVVITVIGVILEFIHSQTFDAWGCGIAACTTVILCDYIILYSKARQELGENK
ncbi:MAG: hypothetical protein K6A74_08050 [Lachnospiraceae bacterium]|nr:hypothetical protein [Lachnospiraceae bacterium]